jgi:hypothetical protein
VLPAHHISIPHTEERKADWYAMLNSLPENQSMYHTLSGRQIEGKTLTRQDQAQHARQFISDKTWDGKAA